MALTSLGAFGATACGAEDPTAGGGHLENAGSVGLDLELGSDVRVNTVSYEIAGNGFSKTGTINVARSKNLRATIGGIPAGSAYTIELRGVDASDSRITCRGSALFDVTAGTTSTARVRFQCTLPRRNGSVDVIGTGNVCPRIDAISAEPSETSVGSSLALSSEVRDSDRFPAAVTYAWRATGGTLDDSTTAAPTFHCEAAGEFTITLDVTDSECTDTLSTSVTCTVDGSPEPPLIKINEVESNGGVPGDWAELYNAGTTAVNLGGLVFKDNDDTHAYVIPNDTIVAPGGYFVVEEAAQGFGLGAADSARLFAANGVLLDSYSWTAHAATTYGRCPNGTGAFVTSTSATKGAANDCSVPVRINEIESNGGVPGDWVELVNTGLSPVNVSGFIFKDNDDTHAAVLPASTIIEPGGYFVIEEALMGFGLGGADAARLFAPDGTTVVDSYAWTAHATTTYGRCPSATGEPTTTSAASKAAANECPGVVTTAAWPGSNSVTTVDDANAFGGNLSGLSYEGATASSAAVLWAVRNGPGTLFRLIQSGELWTPDAENDWSAGKALRYVDGAGNPDTEGFTFAE
ncbi:MAG TPA: lamin tail domain-containing protein, partial [Polyangiaceae bacterium]